jgi:hypothetical protein
MEMVGRYPEARCQRIPGRILDGLDLELAPKGIDILLAVVHADEFHHVVPDGGMGAIGANHEVEIDFDLPGTACRSRLVLSLNLKPGLAFSKVGAGELMVEIEAHVWHSFEYV